LLNITDLKQNSYTQLRSFVFFENKGDNQASFEIMWELEKIKKLVETVPVIEENEGF
jgi:hypothetical protein